MKIYMVGIDHDIASLDIRARFSFTKSQIQEAMEIIENINGISGCVILSTCNRMELWASVKADWKGSLLDILCELKGLEPSEYQKYFIERTDERAVDHLFQLASGLKSQILGEDQILTQVKESLDLSREFGGSDSILEVLFRKAVTAGKKVKTDVVFPKGHESVISNALEKLSQENRTVNGKICMVIGNGVMGKLATRALLDRGAKVIVTLRHYNHKKMEIPKESLGIEYAERHGYLPECEYIISATSSPHLTLTKEMLEESFKETKRTTREKILIDFAVPRDIQKETNEIPGVMLLDMDFFKTKEFSKAIQKAVDQAKVILKEKTDEFYDWLGGYKVMPKIQFVKEEAVKDLYHRVHKSVNKMNLENEEQEKLISTINKATEKTVNKMIFQLKEDLDEDTFQLCIKSLENLYEK